MRAAVLRDEDLTVQRTLTDLGPFEGGFLVQGYTTSADCRKVAIESCGNDVRGRRPNLRNLIGKLQRWRYWGAPILRCRASRMMQRGQDEGI